MKQDHQRVQNMLLSTVGMLCKNALQFNSELKVEGLIGITLDNDEVFLVNINEKFASESENTLITKAGTESRNRAHTDSIQGKRKHSEILAAQEHLVVEIAPTEGTEESNTHSEPEPGIVAQIPSSPKKRKKRRSSKNSENNGAVPAEEYSNNSGSLVIKPEPLDDDLILVDTKDGRTRKLKNSTNSGQTLLTDVSSSFVGFGSFSENESIETKHKSSHDGNSSMIDSSGAFITGLVKNSAASDSNQSASWDSIGGALVPGLPVVASASTQEEWSPSTGRKKIPTAAVGSNQSAAEMVGTYLFYLRQMQTRMSDSQLFSMMIELMNFQQSVRTTIIRLSLIELSFSKFKILSTYCRDCIFTVFEAKPVGQ